MTLTFDEKRERVLLTMDVEMICETLDITEEDLLDAFEDRFLAALDDFEDYTILSPLEDYDEDEY